VEKVKDLAEITNTLIYGPSWFLDEMVVSGAQREVSNRALGEVIF